MEKFKFTREFYIPAGYVEILRDDDLGVVAFASDNGKSVMGFAGKRQKPDFHERFFTIENAYEFVINWMARLKKNAQSKFDRRELRKSTHHTLKVGDVLRSSWGYEQTNVDYYEVTKIIGDYTVEIRPIAAESKVTGFLHGECVPVPGEYIGEAMRKRVNGDTVKINSFSWARRIGHKGGKIASANWSTWY